MRQSDRLERLAHVMEMQYRQSAGRGTWDPVFTAAYRWEHTQRVVHYGAEIADGEGLDRELCMAACLLHDIAYFCCGEMDNWKDHGRLGADLSAPLLAAAGYAPDELDTVRYAIAFHADGEAGFARSHTPIADAVSDADNVDRFSAVRAVMWCMTELGDLEAMAGMLQGRIARLQGYLAENPLRTSTGRKLFTRKLEFQSEFFQAIVRDVEMTKLPWREQ